MRDDGDKLYMVGPSYFDFNETALVKGDRDVERAYVFSNSSDISGDAATTTVFIAPCAGEIRAVNNIVTEAIADTTISTAAVTVGVADADGSTDGDTDYFASYTPVKASAVGTVTEATLTNTSFTAGQAITVSHVAQAIAGTVYTVVELSLDAE